MWRTVRCFAPGRIPELRYRLPLLPVLLPLHLAHCAAPHRASAAEPARASDSSMASRSNFTWQSWKPGGLPARRGSVRRVRQRQDGNRLPFRPLRIAASRADVPVGGRSSAATTMSTGCCSSPRIASSDWRPRPPGIPAMSRPLRISPRENAEPRREIRLPFAGSARALKPVLRGRLNHMVQVEKIRDSFAHYRRTQQPFAARFLAHRDRLFRHIQDLVDDHAHAAVAVVEDHHLHRIGRLVRAARAGFEHAAQTAPAAGCGPGIAPPGRRPHARWPTAETPQAARPEKAEPPDAQTSRRGTAAAAAARCPALRLLCVRRARLLAGFASTPERWPMPSTSRISATRPSPMMVAPA